MDEITRCICIFHCFVTRQYTTKMGSSKSKTTTPKQQQYAKRKTVDLSQMSARVDSVKISGLQRTKDDYVQKAVQNLFAANSFQDLLEQSAYAKANLSELGIFKDMSIHIDTSRGKKATPNGYEVTFEGNELGRVTGTVGTEVGQNEGAMVIELAAPNIAGRGERVTIHGSYSNRKSTDINIKFTKPFLHTKLGYYHPETSITLFKNSASYLWSKYLTHDWGALFDYSFRLPSNIINHSLQYEWAIREISTIDKQTPLFVREHCGPRLASVLRYIVSYDQRDSMVLPSQGVFFQMTNEMSGFGGNVAYVKNTTHGEINIPLFAGISVQLTGRVGILQTEKKSQNVPISNLFVLGGPLNIRGFKPGGVGQHVEGAALGAQTYWASGLHLWSPLPFNRHFGILADVFRLHYFGTFGNVNSFSLDNMRGSIGAGLAFRIGERARIELNYCRPIYKQSNDIGKEGFQFGIGYEFL